eukprot:SM003390S12835  [mRNA]  locus=s3390:2:1303:- [translate_table: standard]
MGLSRGGRSPLPERAPRSRREGGWSSRSHLDRAVCSRLCFSPRWGCGLQPEPGARGAWQRQRIAVLHHFEDKQGSSPSQPNAIAQVAVIGADGRALLQSLPLDQRQEQSFTFRSVDVRPISRLWVGPATGSWGLDQAVVTVGQASTDAERLSSIGSSAASTSDCSARPSCEPTMEMYVFQAGGELLGDGGQAEAVELRPANAGEASRILSSMQERSAEEVERLRLEGMDEYQALKAELLLTAAVATGLGTGVAGVAAGREVAGLVALGGAAG